jgi:potassium-dependent mechanosensitive channel
MKLVNSMKYKILIYFAITLIFLGQFAPGWTQNKIDVRSDFFNLEQLPNGTNNSQEPKSPIVIDGKKIFSVGGIGGSNAAERAEIVREKIDEAIAVSPNTQVTIQDGNTIYANGIRILNITSADIVEGELLETRAEEWKTKIEQAIERAKLERSTIYIQRRSIIAGLLFLFTIIISRFLDRLQKYPFRQAIQKIIPGIPSNTSPQPSNITTFFRLKLGFAQFALWIITILIILEFFPLFRQWRYRLFRALNESFVIFGGSEFSVFKVLILLGLFLVLILISTYITDLLRSKILRITRMNRGSQEVILIITKYGLISIGTIILLQTSGLNLSSLALLGSALGVGIGFGFQDIAKNFASGLVLLFERTIKVGDFIQVGEHLGVVEKVGARSIVLKTLDRVSIVVPNSRFLAEEVINWNHNNTASRLHLPVGIAYGSDVGKVKAALLKAAEENRDVLTHPQPQVFFTEFGDNSLNLELLVWVSDPSRQQPIKSELYFRIEEFVRELNIEVPFPQRDLHLRTGELPLTVSPQLENYLIMFLRNLNSRNTSKN